MQWDYRAIEPGTYDVIFVSPPCQDFSVAKTIGKRNLGYALKLVQCALQIVEHLQPRAWVLENPQSGILAKHPMMRSYPHRDFDYCQFVDWGYRKRTRIWGSSHLEKISSVLCDGKTCCNLVQGPDGNLRHRQWLGGRGYQPTTRLKNRVPLFLVEHVFSGWQDSQFPPPHHLQKKVHFADPLVRSVEQCPTHFEFAKSRRSADLNPLHNRCKMKKINSY